MASKYHKPNPARKGVNIICLCLLGLVFIWLWFVNSSNQDSESSSVELQPEPKHTLRHHKRKRDPTIFVAISAYRDGECAGTLLDMYHKADKPHRVFTGVVAYYKPSNYTLGEHCQDRMLTQYSRQITYFIANYTDARGPCLARWQCSQMFQDEDYYMQIDSHMKFAPGWDTRYIKMLHDAPSKKALLTAYPASYEQKDLSWVPVVCKSTWNWQNIPTWEAALVKITINGTFRETPLIAGGFWFTYGQAVKEVPFDPRLDYLFTGEETTHSVRMWTHGWDLYAPNENLIFHHYMRKGSPKFWEDLGGDRYSQGMKESARIILQLLNGTMPYGYKYGMGTVRSREQYWTWARMDWKTKTSHAKEKFC